MKKEDFLEIWQRRRKADRRRKTRSAQTSPNVVTEEADRVFRREFEIWMRNNRGICSFYNGLAGDWDMFLPPEERKKRGLVHAAPDPLAD